MKNSIYHSKNGFECIRSHEPTQLLCLSPKTNYDREILSLTSSSSHEELNRPGTCRPKNFNPYYGMIL